MGLANLVELSLERGLQVPFFPVLSGFLFGIGQRHDVLVVLALGKFTVNVGIDVEQLWVNPGVDKALPKLLGGVGGGFGWGHLYPRPDRPLAFTVNHL